MASGIQGDIHTKITGDGPAVLLLHSHGLSGRQFRALEAALVSGGYRAVVPDLAGHGRSLTWPPEEPFHFRVDVAGLLTVLRGADAPVHVVGHSYGGFLGLCLARAEPAMVASLALYDPVAFGVLDRTADPEWRDDLARVTFDVSGEAFLRRFVDYWSGAGAWQGLRDDARAEFTRAARVIRDGAEALVGDRTGVEAYRELRVPTLLMTGTATPVAERLVVRRLAEGIPGARLVTVEGAGHMGPLTHAATVNEAILGHLRG